jgi:hypothetical protein
MARYIKYLVILFVFIAGYLLAQDAYTPSNTKPIIKVSFHNMWTESPLRGTPIKLWPKTMVHKIHMFLHPEERLKEFGIINDILTEKYNIKITDSNPDIIIDTVFDDKPLPSSRAIKIFFTGEAVKVRNPDNYDLAMGFDYIDHPNYIRVPLYYMYPLYDANNIRADYSRGTCNPHKPYFACFLYSNGGHSNPKRFDGAIARNELFDKISAYKRVESGGKYQNNIGYIVPREDTMEWMSQCKFVVSYENQTYDGYMTEKPFLSYLAGSVPLYYGDRHAMEDINSKAVIFQGDFASQDDMIEYLKKVDNDDELYCQIWNQKIITDPAKNYHVVRMQVEKILTKLLGQKLPPISLQ